MGPIVVSIAAACAVHRVGIVDTSDGVSVMTTDHGREPLMLVGEGPRRLQGLDDHLVEITGRTSGGRVAVSSFRVLEGPSGFGAWFGPVQVFGSQVGIADPIAGQVILVDDGAAEELRPLVGEWVAVEGYVDGPQRLHVVAFVVSSPPDPTAPSLP